jgi:lipid II:glycine glycyltransferase (peptidoglycan interpeptide bridge formation enzyme)
MRLLEVADAGTWDRALLALPNPHILQSWAWGEFKARHGWRTTRLLFQEEGETVAAASVLQRSLSRLPLSILYVPKGPALDWNDSARAARVLEELEGLARRRALLVKIDPDVYLPDGAPAFSSRPAWAPEITHLLAARGWRFSGEQIQFRNTLLLDLTRTDDELLAEMKPKTRYNVRLATRRGVTIRPVSAHPGAAGLAGGLDLFYRLYAETAERDGFAIRPPAYYHDAWGSFLEAGLAHLLLAEFQGELVAGLLLFTFGPTAWYMYGASAARHREHMPNYLLQWEAVRWARAAGCTLYDLWGAPEALTETDPMWGVVRFKQGLGGQLARGLGAWDYAVSRVAYRLYAGLLPRYLDWLRGRRKTSNQPAEQQGSL